MWQAVQMFNAITFSFWMLCLLWSPTTLAWGNLGHRITGHIAEPLLTHSARKQVQQLLGEEPLAVAATFMDMQREALRDRWPRVDQWHYDNQPVCGKSMSGRQGHCADGQCATAQIEQQRKALANSRLSQAERALALRLLIHMLGDIHQPLHMGDNNDRGGNNINVRLYSGGKRYRLHEVLDTVLIQQQIGSMRANYYADELRQRYQSQQLIWQRGSLREWAQQTHQLAVSDTYGKLPGFACHATSNATLTLPRAYVERAQQYLPEQLTKAGVRIAAVLNATLR